MDNPFVMSVRGPAVRQGRLERACGVRPPAAAVHRRAVFQQFGAHQHVQHHQTRTLLIVNGANSSLPKHQTWLAQGHADSPDSPFHELRLSEAERNAGGIIGRRNYSFLTSSDGQQPSEPVDWATLYQDPTKPLVVDLGCGAGRYVLLMAHRKGDGSNYLGVDVHKALLDRANGWAAARSMTAYVHYLQANAVLSAGALLASYPGPVELVSIQYPDPQQRRQRHIVGRELVGALAEVLRPGARVYLASDFEDTATYMRNAFERYGNGSFRMDDIHSTQPVFPCTPLDPASTPSPHGTRPVASSSLSAAPTQGTSHGATDASSTDLKNGSSLPSPQPSTSTEPLPTGESGVHDRLADAETEREARVAGSIDEEDLLWFRGAWQEAGWLVGNPVGAPTEREVYVEKATKGCVYRALLIRM